MATHRRGARSSQWPVADLLRREDRPRGGGALDPRLVAAVGGLLACGAVVTVALSAGEPDGSGPLAPPDTAPSPTAQATPTAPAPVPVPPARPHDGGAPARARHGDTAAGQAADAMRAGARAAREAAAGAGGAPLALITPAGLRVAPPAARSGAGAAPPSAHRAPAQRARQRGTTGASGPAGTDSRTSRHRAEPGLPSQQAAEPEDGSLHRRQEDAGQDGAVRRWTRPSAGSVSPRTRRGGHDTARPACPEPRAAHAPAVPAQAEKRSRSTAEESGIGPDARHVDEQQAPVGDGPGDRGAGDEPDEAGDRPARGASDEERDDAGDDDAGDAEERDEHRGRRAASDAEEVSERDDPDRARRAYGGHGDADTREAGRHDRSDRAAAHEGARRGHEPATAAFGEERDDIRELAHRPVHGATLLAVLDDLHRSGRAAD
jgi:hypothetical protein